MLFAFLLSGCVCDIGGSGQVGAGRGGSRRVCGPASGANGGAVCCSMNRHAGAAGSGQNLGEMFVAPVRGETHFVPAVC